MTEVESTLKCLLDVSDFAAKHIAKKLEGMIRKQIANEVDKIKMLQIFVINDLMGKPSKSHSEYYMQGIEDTL